MQWIKIIFISCLVSLSFVLGAAALFWNVSPANVLREKFSSIESIIDASSMLFVDNVAFDVNAALKNKVVTWDKAGALAGYNALVIRYQKNAYLFDMNGAVVHEWTMPFSLAFPEHPHVSNPVPESNIYFEKVHIFPNGDLLGIFHAMGTAPFGYGMVKIDKNSKIIWKLAENLHHDFYVSPTNGHIYSLKQEFTPAPESIRRHVPYDILADSVVEINAEDGIVSSFSLIDAFANSPYAELLYSTYDRGPKWDYMHANSIEVLEPDMAHYFPQWPAGSYLVSMRNISTIAVVDPTGKTVLWAYNGLWKNQHAAHFNSDGTILLFDNRGLVSDDKEYSRILKIDPTTLAIKRAYGSHTAPFYTNAYGRVQQLANQNLLITDTLGCQVFEVNSSDKIVWSFKLPKIFSLHMSDISTHKNIDIHDRTQQDLTGALPNLGTAIVYAERYTPEQLPFLKEAVQ